MSNEHIARAFDRDLEAVQAMIMKMGGLVETALSEAARALDTQDEVLADQVRANDAVIDALEEQVNAECARLIALRAPMGTDLRTVLSVMKIASNLERCGDYAKNLAKRSKVLAGLSQGDGGGEGAHALSPCRVMVPCFEWVCGSMACCAAGGKGMATGVVPTVPFRDRCRVPAQRGCCPLQQQQHLSGKKSQ